MFTNGLLERNSSNVQSTVNVSLKKSVLDPQGQTVLHALESLGFNEAKKVRMGKYFELTLDSKDKQKAEARLKDLCEKLLINPVIEEYSYELVEQK